jgi:hypothetical protein
MIGLLSRFIGLWLVAGALVGLVVDATKTIAAGTVTLTPLGQAWYWIAPASVMAVQQFVQQTIEPFIGHWLWDPAIQSLLLLPTWIVLGALGFVLTWLGGRRRRRLAFA